MEKKQKGHLLIKKADRRKCLCIAAFVIWQCILIFIASLTIFYCVWSPDHFNFEFYKLASIMYLYDKKACDSSVLASKKVRHLDLSNDTKGADVLPFTCLLPIVTVSTRISSSTRGYVKSSNILHFLWMTTAIIVRFIINHQKSSSRIIKISLTVFYYSFIIIVFFDLSMAIVYLSHIRQSLSRGMIVRYSGWSVQLQIKNADDFGGWLPMIASACWLRGFVILGLNLYCGRKLQIIKKKVRRIEFHKRYVKEWNEPIPEAAREQSYQAGVIIFTPGDMKPME